MWSLDHLSVSVPSRGLYKTKPPSPRVIKTLIQVPRQGQETRTKNKKTIVIGGHRDHVSACLCHMLYCIETSTPYNLAFFILKRMEKTRFKPKELLPYGMLMTRLFKHVVSVSPELAFDQYLLHDRAMHPLAPYYERKTRADRIKKRPRGIFYFSIVSKKRPRESNASSSSTTQNHPSSSLSLDTIVDENDDDSFHSNSSSSPSQNVSSSSNVNGNWRRPIRGGLEQSQLLDMLLLLWDVDTNNTPDAWVCNLNTSNSYSVSDLRVKINDSILEPNGNQTRWNKILPIKINIHSWRLRLDRLPTRCNLDDRGIDIHSKRCPVRDEDLESNQHLFVDCFLAASPWRKIAYWWGLDDYPKQLQNLIEWGTSTNLNTLSKLCFDVVVQATTWVIWRFRNRVCFDLKPPRKDILEEEIKLLSHSWITHRLKKSHPLWIDWIRDPILACKNLL
ncbi:pentatricopeptide repeat-containing protein [Tanacetum coccineum]